MKTFLQIKLSRIGNGGQSEEIYRNSVEIDTSVCIDFVSMTQSLKILYPRAEIVQYSWHLL